MPSTILVESLDRHVIYAGHMMHWTEPAALVDRLEVFFGEPPIQKTHVPPPRLQIGTELPPSAQTAMPPPRSRGSGVERAAVQSLKHWKQRGSLVGVVRSALRR